MLNRAANSLQSQNDGQGIWETGWHVDQSPGLRVALLFTALLIPLLVVGWRLAYVQCVLPEDYAAEIERTFEKPEAIPSYTGRILASDGQVLAQDVETFFVTAHYRWLEEPANPRWLKECALSRLSPTARRNAELVAAEMERVLELRRTMWQRLSELTKTPLEQLLQTRAGIQSRVERIQRAVAERRDLHDETENPRTPAASASWWGRARQVVIDTLTTSPRRQPREQQVLKEELGYHLLVPEVTLKMRAEIEAYPAVYPGLRVELSTRRVYPAQTLAAHVVGNRHRLDETEAESLRKQLPQGDPLDFRAGDWIGETGIERYYDRRLRGLRGERRLTVNRRGEVLRDEVVREPRVGRDVELTLNLALQREAERLLDAALVAPVGAQRSSSVALPAQGGVIVVMDVRNGEIAAAASAPRYNLNVFVEHDAAAWENLNADSRKPLFNRLTQMALPPGSVFKPLTAVAMLHSGRINPRHQVQCQGYLDHPDKFRCYHSISHGGVDLTEALARSCNVYFFTAARQIGASPIHDWAQRFGFGQPTGIDLPGEVGGRLPGSNLTRGRGTRRSQPAGDALGFAIGQSSLIVTPLQIVRMMAAIANGGKLVTPRLVTDSAPRLLSADEQAEVSPSDPRSAETTSIQDLTSETLAQLREGLRQVVASNHGTGKTVRLKQVAIAGKTGTAEVKGQPDHAWFAGFVPAERPRYAFVVVLEHAGSGGAAAGPVAKHLVEAMLKEGLLGQTQLTQRTE